MKLLRTFRRLNDPTDPHCWAERMDSLLVADPIELLEFVSDAIIALLAAAPEGARVRSEGLPVILEHLQQTTEAAKPQIERCRRRHTDILASLTEHMPQDEARARLAHLARTAPWEPPTNNTPSPDAPLSGDGSRQGYARE